MKQRSSPMLCTLDGLAVDVAMCSATRVETGPTSHVIVNMHGAVVFVEFCSLLSHFLYVVERAVYLN